MITDDIKAISKWAKEHGVEININEHGSIALYAEAGGLHVCIDKIKVKSIEAAVEGLEWFRVAGWKVN